MAGRSGRGSAAGVLVVVTLFLVSFGASAGATVLVGSGEPSPPPDSGAESAAPAPSPTPTASAAVTTAPTPAATPEPKASPSVATKAQIKSAKKDLCDAEASALPALSASQANAEWARIFEIHLSKNDINPGPIDGDFDMLTARGTRELQETYGIEPTGKVGDATWAALWNDECYVAPEPEPTTWDPSWNGGGSSSGGESGGGSGGGGGTLDRVE